MHGVNDLFPTFYAMTHAVVIVIFRGFQLLDAAGPISAFEMANRFAPGYYDLAVLSHRGGLIASSSGISMETCPYSLVETPDTLMVVGGEGAIEALNCQQTMEFITHCASRSQRVSSVCSGAYLLAAAGLLNGRRATTHWQRTQDFSLRFPDVHLDADKIYIRDGNIWTSAGISAGIDLSLALITADLGEKVARQVARQLVVYYQRPGGQSQYSALLEMSTSGGRFISLLEYARKNLSERLSVDDLAKQVFMSPRHFSRNFTTEIGVSPARAVERLRVEAASAALESGKCSIQEISKLCGFSDPERMRRAFLRIMGVPPSTMKRCKTN